MRVIIAPNAFKDSLSQGEAVEAIRLGVLQAAPGAETVGILVSDGGDGLIEVMHGVMGGRLVEMEATGPLFRPVGASYLFIDEEKVAILEMARSSGLALLRPGDRDVMNATSLGLGELVLDALRRGAKRLIIGIGGSATNDGGVGFATALGGRFLDAAGRPVRPVGGELSRIASMDISAMSSLLSGIEVDVVCDVDILLCGPSGAAAIFGPQKGATPEQVALLDAGLASLAGVIKNQMGLDVACLPGAGAAGGLGAGLVAFAGATLRTGVDVILDLVGIDAALGGADLVFTAEGRLDHQTIYGKGPAGVAARARKAGVPCVAIAGSIDYAGIGPLYDLGLTAAFSLCPGPVGLGTALENAGPYLTDVAAQATRVFLGGRTHAPPG